MLYEEKAAGTPQRIVCENREKLEITGVLEVMLFDEESVTARTSQGELTVRGSGLHVDRLSLDSGELSLTGNIGAIEYSDEERGGGFFSRLFGQMAVTIGSQVRAFIGSGALGIALGICYDVFGLFRGLKHGKILTVLADAAFSLLFLLALFCYSMSAAFGVVRLYILLGTLLGAVVYFGALCRLVRPVLHLLAEVVALALRAAVYPLVLWGRFLKKLLENAKYLFKFFAERYTINNTLKNPPVQAGIRRGDGRMKKKKTSIILIIVLLAIIAYSAVNLISVQGLLKKAQGELDGLHKDVELQTQENSELQEDIESVGEESQIKDIARDELGLVENGEIIFYDVSN